MKYYFAPLEGITGYIYRETHHTFYPGMDRYYTPFLVPKEKCDLNTREYHDVLPEHNKNMNVIPQILTNKSGDFLRMANYLEQNFGYQEINLNLGCPSKTVVGKKRGSGFLSIPDQLDCFLDEIFNKSKIKISIKTRIGKDSADEYDRLLEIFRKYPIAELIVHPRTQKDFYQNKPDLEAFSKTFHRANWEICYNGDLCRMEDIMQVKMQFSELNHVMIGRGLLTKPYLVKYAKMREKNGMVGQSETENLAELEREERKRLHEFHKTLLEKYQSALSGEKTVLFKMKELWLYMCNSFTQPEKYWKKMKKAQHLYQFEEAVCRMIEQEKLREFLQK